jgi:acetoin utilization protein AcuB
MKVSELMQRDVMTAPLSERAEAAWNRMQERGCDHLVVMDGDAIAGVVSLHDLAGPNGGAHRRMGRRVADLMRRGVVTVTAGTTVARAARSMRARRVGCLPVLMRRKIVGIVTTGDMLGLLADLAEKGPASRKGTRAT